MSVYTTVTAEDLEPWLTHYGVGTLVDLKGIAAGIENTNYFVTTTTARFVLTLFEKLTPAELPFYLNLMAHLADHGLPCPKPVVADSGALYTQLNGKPAALVSFLSGHDLANASPADCAEVGTTLARIHLAGADFRMRMDNPRGPRWWRTVMPEIVPFMAEADTTLLREEVRFQSLYRLTDLPRGAIHADLFRDNVLFERGRITGVIDFYFACTDIWLYDVAITVNDWCISEDGRLDPARTEAFIKAYAGVRRFTAMERGAWPVMLRAAALRFWVSRLYDFHLPRPGELTHAKDPEHFRRILTSHIAHEHDLPPLAA